MPRGYEADFCFPDHEIVGKHMTNALDSPAQRYSSWRRGKFPPGNFAMSRRPAFIPDFVAALRQ